MNKPRITAGQFLSTVVACIVVLLVLTPFLWMVSTSLRPGGGSFDLPPRWIPETFFPDNYFALANSTVPFPLFFLNSLVISATVTIVGTLLSALAGYAFARLSFRFSKPLFLILLFSIMIPAQVSIIPLYLIIDRMGLADTPFSIILPLTANAFGVFMFRQFFLTVPLELSEAAKIDGASHARIFASVMMPLAKSTTIALGIVTFTNSYNEYFLPLIFINSWEKMTLPLGLSALQNVYGSGNVGMLMAGLTASILPIVVIYAFLQRYVIKGMLEGSVKG